MRKTTNYGLALYDKEDKMSITAEENSLNANMELIDKTLKEKADNNDIPTKLSELDDDKNFITSEELENKGYLTDVPSEYITETELNNKGYLTEHQDISKLATKEEVKAKASIEDMTTYIEEHKAELKGADGVDGKDGTNGTNGSDGQDGYTPVKGTDYWTEEDQTVIKDDARAYIVEELAKRGQLKPEFANTIEECTDTTKLYVLPDGYIYGYIYTNVEVGGYTNRVDITSDDFKSGYRYNASSQLATTTTTNAFASNMFDCKPGDVLRIRGITGSTSGTTAANFVISRLLADGSNYKSNNNIAYLKENTSLTVSPGQQCWNAYTTDADGTITWTYAINNGGSNFADSSTIVKARIAGIATNGIENVIVTVNEEIKEPTIVREYQWANTGHAFVPADYEDRIIDLETDVTLLKTNVASLKTDVDYLKENSGNTNTTVKSDINWYAFGDSITQGYVSYLKEDGTASSKLVPSAKQSWVYKVAELNGYNVTNYAVGGTGYAYGNPNVTSTARKQVDEVDFTDCDLVTLAWGCNDWKYNGGPVGSVDDDKDTDTTPCASLKYVIEKIQSQNPLCKIIVLTPINVCFWGTFEGNYGLSYSFSKTGTLEEFYNAIVSVCKYYGVEYIDNTHSSIFNRVNIKSLLLDGVHPTAEAYVVMGKELAKKINIK